MILYFSGTGNSLAIARHLAERLNEQLMPLTEAVGQDLTCEKRVGLVFPTYDFNIPPAVRELLPRLTLSPRSYVFAVISCGGQVGNSVWALRRMLRKQGVELAYSHKVRVPDNSALAFGRNPNAQLKKFDRVPERMELIIGDLQAQRHALHYSCFSFFSWIMGLPMMEKGMTRMLCPKVVPAKCIGCGICAKVCPMENISLSPGSAAVTPQTGKAALVASVGDRCTVCLGCVHACPQQAIMVNGREALKDRQYRHPQVKLKDLLRR